MGLPLLGFRGLEFRVLCFMKVFTLKGHSAGGCESFQGFKDKEGDALELRVPESSSVHLSECILVEASLEVHYTLFTSCVKP